MVSDVNQEAEMSQKVGTNDGLLYVGDDKCPTKGAAETQVKRGAWPFDALEQGGLHL